ncbi:hypothetical protein RSAG8_12375, partial [Rhizoctonia solani AG-8 WAC10335]
MKETRDRLDTYDPKGKAYIIWVHLGGKTTKVNAEDTAFFWRDAAYVSYFKLQWYKREAMSEMIKLVEEVKEKLLPYTIEKKAAYKEWDPDNLFKFEQSVELPGAIATGPRSGTGEDLRNVEQSVELPGPIRATSSREDMEPTRAYTERKGCFKDHTGGIGVLNAGYSAVSSK